MPITRCNSAGFQILLGLALLVASIAMLSPSTPGNVLFPFADKVWHLLTFAVLAFLADAGWPEQDFGMSKYLPLLLYGLIIEGLQAFIPTRFFGLDDIAANVSGLAIYAWFILPMLRRWQIR